MANCTPVNVEAAEFCDNLEDEQAGLKEIIPVWLHQDVESYPAYSTAADVQNGITESMAKLRADGPIVMKASKFPIQLHCILGKSKLNIKSSKRSTNTELKLHVQNTAHNRGVFHSLQRSKFSIGAPQTEGDMILIGQSSGTDVGYLAEVQDQDGVMAEFGEDFSDDKYVEVIIVCRPKHPVVYAEAIAYS